MLIIFFLLVLVNAVFAVTIANLFTAFPASVLPYWLQVPVAIAVGVLVYKRGVGLFWPSIVALFLLFAFIFVGAAFPVELPKEIGGLSSTAWWVLIMLLYGAIASRLPVWLLLQPRDYINSHMLFLGLIIIYLGLFATNPDFIAPAFREAPADAPPLLPLLFVTVACGAISGFHGLVGSGTSSKQIDKETDARFVGYFGAMGEGMLALAAIMATAAGFASLDAWNEHYGSWKSASAGGTAAFVTGAGNFLSNLGIPAEIGTTFISIMVIAFAATTLDTSMRLQRFILSEIGEQYKIKSLQNINISTVVTLITCAALAFLADPSNPGAGDDPVAPVRDDQPADGRFVPAGADAHFVALGAELSRFPDSADLYRRHDHVQHGAQHHRFHPPREHPAGGDRNDHSGSECLADLGGAAGGEPPETRKPAFDMSRREEIPVEPNLPFEMA